jgi:hypothetical protein
MKWLEKDGPNVPLITAKITGITWLKSCTDWPGEGGAAAAFCNLRIPWLQSAQVQQNKDDNFCIFLANVTGERDNL